MCALLRLAATRQTDEYIEEARIAGKDCGAEQKTAPSRFEDDSRVAAGGLCAGESRSTPQTAGHTQGAVFAGLKKGSSEQSIHTPSCNKRAIKSGKKAPRWPHTAVWRISRQRRDCLRFSPRIADFREKA